MAKSKSYGGLIFMTLVVLGAAGGTWYYYHSKADKQPEYSTVKVARGNIRQSISATGSLQTTSQVTVSSQVSGNVVDINADFNDKVKAGQWLLKIDPSTYEQRLKQAKADLDAATANTIKIREDAARTKDLFAKNLVPKSDYDSSVAQLAQAESLLLEAAPVAPLYFNTRTWLMSPRVRGWQEDSLWTRSYLTLELAPATNQSP